MARVRKCPKGHQLLPRMYWKGGAYYRVYRNQWTRLGATYNIALRKHAELETPRTDWGDLLTLVYESYERRHKAGELAENTWQQYQIIRPRIEQGFRDFRPHEILTRDVTAFLDQYEATPNMANRMLSVLRVVFERGCRSGAIDFNPSVGIRRFKEKRRTRYITDQELTRICEHANEHTELIIRMAYLTGQRIGDVLKIKRTDIVDDIGIAFVQQKSKAKLMVAWTPDMKLVVERAKALRRVPCAYLFHPLGKGTPYNYTAIRDNWNRARDAAGVAYCTLHDIRAKALTDIKRSGGDAKALAGHAMESTTLRYLRDIETPVVDGPVLEDLRNLRKSDRKNLRK